jgi:hypothetical protein
MNIFRLPKAQRLFQLGERDCSISVFAALANVAESELINDLPGASRGEITVEGWEQWLRSRGLEPKRREGCPTDVLPCAHLVANSPRGINDFHWVYRDELGDVHDPSPVSSSLTADHPHMRELKSYDTHHLTITVGSSAKATLPALARTSQQD